MSNKDLKLIDGYLNNSLSKDELQLFNERMQEEEFSDLYLEFVLQEEMLEDALEGEALELQAERKLKKVRQLTYFVALAASLLIAFQFYKFLNPVAVLDQISGHIVLVRDGQERIIAKDLKLSPGDVLRTNVGNARILYSDGTQINLDEKTTLLVYGSSKGKKILLNHGRLDADVAPQPDGKPLILQTPLAQAEVLGTSLSLTSLKGESVLNVTEGAVRFKNLKGNKDVVKAGQFARAMENAPILAQVVKPKIEIKPRENDPEVLKHDRWLKHSFKLRKDKDLVAYYDFQSLKEKGSKYLLNKADATSGLPLDGELNNVLPIEGRWRGKKSLYFSEFSYVDCGRHEVFNLQKALTIFTWVKVKSLDRHFQTIVSKGDSSWRLARFQESDTLEFACSGLRGSPYLRGVKPLPVNKWLLITATYDGNEVKLYRDNQLELAIKAEGEVLVNDLRVLIGNNSQLPNRNFKGWIDELGIMKRAMSHQEIQVLYDAGKP
ncbi:MAG: FecR domain-containing protein [Lentisphaeraceae bacterium]|nr:FecR domain-containing protein [Lentisphaeraceae bacterium]